MDFVSGFLYSPVNEKKKNDDLTQGETLLVVNSRRNEITIIEGNHKIESGKEKRIPLSRVVSFKIGSYFVHELVVNETTNGFFQFFMVYVSRSFYSLRKRYSDFYRKLFVEFLRRY